MNILKKCKICGKPLVGCRTCEGKVMNWKNVACCPEHFQQYVDKVQQSRLEDQQVLPKGDKHD